MWDEQDEMTHIEDSIRNGDFEKMKAEEVVKNIMENMEMWQRSLPSVADLTRAYTPKDESDRDMFRRVQAMTPHQRRARLEQLLNEVH